MPQRRTWLPKAPRMRTVSESRQQGKHICDPFYISRSASCDQEESLFCLWTSRVNRKKKYYCHTLHKFHYLTRLKEWHKHKNIVFILRPVLSAWHDLQAVPSYGFAKRWQQQENVEMDIYKLFFSWKCLRSCLCLGARERRKAARKSSVGRLSRRVTFAAGFIELLQIYKRLENVFDFPRTWHDSQSLPNFFRCISS